MGKQRYSVTDIAEILIEEIQEFKKSAIDIQKSSQILKNTSIEINPASINHFQDLTKDLDKMINDHVTTMKKIVEKNVMRLPNWFYTVLTICVAIMIGFSIYTYYKLENYNFLELENQYLKTEIEKLRNN